MPNPAIIAIIFIIISGLLIFKNFSFNQPQPTSDKSFEPTMQNEIIQSPSPIKSSPSSYKPVITYSPSPAASNTPTVSAPSSSPSPIPKPTPQAGVYKLEPTSTSNIKLKLSVSAGYSASVLLKDSNGDIIPDQSDFNFVWNLADPSLVIGKVGTAGEMYGGCTGSSQIKNPCPNNNYTINKDGKTGSTTLTVKAEQKSTGKIVGETQFNITVEE